MPSNGSSWEGTALVFFMTFTVLMGVAYTLGIAYRITIPWLVILLISAALALGLRLQRRGRR